MLEPDPSRHRVYRVFKVIRKYMLMTPHTYFKNPKVIEIVLRH